MSGAAGQVRETLGRIESKIDSLGDDVERLVRLQEGADSERVDELLAVVRDLKGQIGGLRGHEHTPGRRRLFALGAAVVSASGFLWAFAQPVYVQLLSHLKFVP